MCTKTLAHECWGLIIRGYWLHIYSLTALANYYKFISRRLQLQQPMIPWRNVLPLSAVPGPSTAAVPGPSTAAVPGPSTAAVPGPSTAAVPGPSTAVIPGPSTAPPPLVHSTPVSKKRTCMNLFGTETGIYLSTDRDISMDAANELSGQTTFNSTSSMETIIIENMIRCTNNVSNTANNRKRFRCNRSAELLTNQVFLDTIAEKESKAKPP